MGALVGRLKGWSCHSQNSGSFTRLAVDSSCWLRSYQRLTARATTWDVFYHMSFSKYGDCVPGLSTLREREQGRAVSFLRLRLQGDAALLPANSLVWSSYKPTWKHWVLTTGLPGNSQPWYFLTSSLLSDRIRCFNIILYIFCPTPGIWHFPKELASFQWERTSIV